VLQDSPAEKAGLKTGDIVVKFNGRSVESADQLRNAVAATAPGTKAEVVFFRDGKQQKLSLTIGELEDETVAATDSPRDALPTTWGLSVQNLTQDLARQLGVDRDEQGVVITDVESGSIAARAGLRPKDVIVTVGNTSVRSVREFREAVEKAETGGGIRLQVKREDVRLFVFLKPR
jgi:serine protease Do